MTHLKKTVIKFGGKKPATAPASTFEVRQGTAAVCRHMVNDHAGATLFHAFLEYWVERKRKVTRKRNGVTREWVFLSGDDLVTLSGLTKRQVQDRAIPALKECSFFIIKQGRMTPNHRKQYQIHFDQEAFWDEVRAMLDPTGLEIETLHGHTWAKKAVDRKLLPYLFKRLYDGVKGDG